MPRFVMSFRYGMHSFTIVSHHNISSPTTHTHTLFHPHSTDSEGLCPQGHHILSSQHHMIYPLLSHNITYPLMPFLYHTLSYTPIPPQTLKDSALKDTIVFGVGIHHAGLDNHDRQTVEELFTAGKIQVIAS